MTGKFKAPNSCRPRPIRLNITCNFDHFEGYKIEAEKLRVVMAKRNKIKSVMSKITERLEELDTYNGELLVEKIKSNGFTLGLYF